MGDLADRLGDEAYHHQVDTAQRGQHAKRGENTGPHGDLIGHRRLLAGFVDMVLLVNRKVRQRLRGHFDRLVRGGEAGERFGGAAFGGKLDDLAGVLAHLLPARLEGLEIGLFLVIEIGRLERGGLRADDLLVLGNGRFGIGPLELVCGEEVGAQGVLELGHGVVHVVCRKRLGDVILRDFNLGAAHDAHAPDHRADRGDHDQRQHREDHRELASDRSVPEIFHAE